MAPSKILTNGFISAIGPNEANCIQRLSVAGDAGEGVAGCGLVFGGRVGATPVVAGGLPGEGGLGLLEVPNIATTKIPRGIPRTQSHIILPPR
jgi:hypothetical protein